MRPKNWWPKCRRPFTSCKLDVTDAPRADHAQYLDNWLSVLNKDKRAILTASSKAQEATDYLFKLQS